MSIKSISTKSFRFHFFPVTSIIYPPTPFPRVLCVQMMVRSFLFSDKLFWWWTPKKVTLRSFFCKKRAYSPKAADLVAVDPTPPRYGHPSHGGSYQTVPTAPARRGEHVTLPSVLPPPAHLPYLGSQASPRAGGSAGEVRRAAVGWRPSTGRLARLGEVPAYPPRRCRWQARGSRLFIECLQSRQGSGRVGGLPTEGL